MSLIVHHLNNSRSQRILWLLEEIGAPYEIKYYDRDATTNLAPPELIAVHPLGKSPVISDGDRVIIEGLQKVQPGGNATAVEAGAAPQEPSAPAEAGGDAE